MSQVGTNAASQSYYTASYATGTQGGAATATQASGDEDEVTRKIREEIEEINNP